MSSRRQVLRGAVAGCTAAVAGCVGLLRDDPVPEVGDPELEGSLVGNGNDTATVTVDVENRGGTGEIRVSANVLDNDGNVLETYERTVEMREGETRQFEFEVTPREDAATVSVEATTT